MPREAAHPARPVRSTNTVEDVLQQFLYLLHRFVTGQMHGDRRPPETGESVDDGVFQIHLRILFQGEGRRRR